ncbi:hypothetical protein BD410DRAFT_145085 [Rickenella mellea]|uniref:tRNA-splicing endonuclease subunit Sen2 n=1 Tax=Rickenella mellea TaxID=50990 RepID=A0A4Y7Q7P7_9AGAM|nr:hypothetical protein BD410DRAFT_145085 [Rickenella mellea]
MPSTPRQGATKAIGRKNENSRIYAYPLPLVLEPPEPPIRWIPNALGLFGFSSFRVLNPYCKGIFDPDTKSVWITNSGDSLILWRRGFFGKGNLSRSEPSWHARQVNQRAIAGGVSTAEEITAKRRAERKQFKLDRAAALAAAAQEAEAAFAAGGSVSPTPTINIPSAATWKPSTPLVAGEADSKSPVINPDVETNDVEDIEHLQLTLPEAFFLIWALRCLGLSQSDPTAQQEMSLSDIWLSFQNIHLGPSFKSAAQLLSPPARFDNPFLINYVVYHHYRSLGWVVKGGAKFCVDYLLYRRGPVFHHAEFALVVCPVYEDPTDKKSSPFELQNTEPFSWSWLSTINRVNSQVQKTLILTYVTIPASAKYSPQILLTPSCLPEYSVREVTLRRFVPARMRD